MNKRKFLKRGEIALLRFVLPAQRAGFVPALPAKIAYLPCELPQNNAPAALLFLLIPAQIQLALRTEVHARALRTEVHARALRASQNVKQAGAWIGARCA